MIDSSGAHVVLASSSDENHPPENITDGNNKTFWMSTGMFPQEFIIRFPETTNISTVTMDSYNIKHLKIERNTSPNAANFEPVTQEEIEQTEGHLQLNSISLKGCRATHLRFIVTEGYDHFVSVHRISVKT
ncbi:intraflagellar transport protein 25 homolog [Xiphophorus maculatus]|uniref:Heat shock protein, alpha-crystallin-related, b11 n=1 Tax=Xiphophorus maculatus TaxID=8083 RepID=A0A3B5QXR2_XIPMA|nr:intraflagellar transport protein 25 homolog [Xiphophorus maculatus]XP_027890595.1 intraflagellar transport protein 25 homolog [Xiphophorus couchianus]